MKHHTLALILFTVSFAASGQKYITHYNKGNYGKALGQAEKAIDENSRDLDAYLYKSLSYMHLATDAETKEDYPFGIESSVSTLRFLKTKDKDETYLPKHSEQVDSIITTASFYLFELYEAGKLSRVEKMIDKLLELSPRPEHFFIKGKLLQEQGDEKEAIRSFNTAAAKIYLDYKKGIIPKPYLHEAFLALARSLDEDGDYKSATVIYIRAMNIFKMPEIEDECYSMLYARESYLGNYSEQQYYERFLFCIDTAFEYVEQKDLFNDLRWTAIRNYYESLASDKNYLTADSLISARTCGEQEGLDFVLTRVLSQTRSIYSLQQNKIADMRDEYQIWLHLLDCDANGAANEIKAAEIIGKYISSGEFITATKLIYNLKQISTNKSMLTQLEDKLYSAIALLPDTMTASVDLYEIFQYFPSNKKFRLLQQNASIARIDKLIRDKKFTEAGELLRKQTALYPNDASLKSLYKIWAIEDYNTNYLGSELSYDELKWTGDYDNCEAGTISDAANKKLIQRLNYVRRLAGLPDQSVLDEEWNQKCQEGALMMGANGQLSHHPPADWKCYTVDGATAAGNSNLALGASDVGGLMLQLDDDGIESVGHRRWILNPYRRVFGHGSNGYAMVLWALGGKNSNYPTELTEKFETQFVAWPPPGYVPATLSSRYWSFALENCDFDSVKVEMWAGGMKIECNVLKQSFGYGQNTLVWIPETESPYFRNEVTYTVVLKNVVVYVENEATDSYDYIHKDFTYNVTFIPVSVF